MKRYLYLKFIGVYAVLAFLMLFVVESLGTQLITNRYVSQRAEDLYVEANRLSTAGARSYFSKTETLEDLYENLTVIAKVSGTTIRLIDTSGTEIMNTGRTLSSTPRTIENFNYAEFGPQYYEIGSFYGQYDKDYLNVMVPVTSGLQTRGYLAVSQNMAQIDADVRSMRIALRWVTLVNFLLSFGILLIFSISVYTPLTQIIEGARQFASGNFSHKISVSSRDEMGYLADSLNMMAVELQKNKDYQTKFISNISHDFRSPLTSIKGFTEAMMDGTIPPEMYGRYLKIISSEVVRLEKLTQSILTLNSADADKVVLNKTRFDINSMLRNTAAVFEGSCRRKKIGIDLVLTDEALFVEGDKEKIEQVIYNLLDNAVKFSDRGSRIKLETTLRRDKCYISVKDEGCGIPKDELPRIWDRFYKTDSSRGRDKTGTGLGLSIAKEIINAHGQTISVMSTENVGTEFVFSLDAR